jgi:uncharacterized protein (DUF1330 family)
MTSGYWIAHADITDAAAYERYRAANAAPFHQYGAKFLVRAGPCTTVEGAARSRHVVIEFKDYDTALACYRSAEYQKAMAFRRDGAVMDLVVIAGDDGQQSPAATDQIPEQRARGYWIAHIDYTEPAGYQAYAAAAIAPIGRYGGSFLVRGGAFEKMEGSVRARTVVVAFPSYDAAIACHRSAEYQAAAALRRGRAEFDLTVCEGYDGPQP